jgi:hypothetical protein
VNTAPGENLVKHLLALPVLALLASPAAAFDENDPVSRDIAQILVMKAFVVHTFDVCDQKYGPDPAFAAAKADWLSHNDASLTVVDAAIAKTGKLTDDDRKALEAAIFRQVEGSIGGDAGAGQQCKAIATAVTGRERDIEDFPGGPDIIERLKKA